MIEDRETLIERLAGLELALYRDTKSDAPSYRLQKELENQIVKVKKRLRVILYEVRERDTPEA
jgi:hypothetical protein